MGVNFINKKERATSLLAKSRIMFLLGFLSICFNRTGNSMTIFVCKRLGDERTTVEIVYDAGFNSMQTYYRQKALRAGQVRVE